MLRCCKVITTCFIGRVVREHTTLIGKPLGYFNHSQNYPSPESVLDLLELNLTVEQQVNPGVALDTIIVNNNTDWLPGNNYLDRINGLKTHSGNIVILHRENFGRSFGGNNAAFVTFKDQYEYWLFTEDDILINADQYYSKLVTHFEKQKNAGFIAIQGQSTIGLGPESHLRHAHGGVGLTHRNILQEVVRRNGYLPHCRKNDPQDYHSIIRFGEIAFTNTIVKLGYQLHDAPVEPKLYIFAYDHMRNISVPAGYVGYFERIIHHFSGILHRTLRKLRRLFE